MRRGWSLTRARAAAPAAVALLLGLLLPGAGAPTRAQTTPRPGDYTITSIGTLGGSPSGSQAYGLNEAGDVVGQSTSPDGTAVHAVLWRNGILTDLGQLGGGLTTAYAINASAHVVGEGLNADFCFRGFVWQTGVLATLDSLGAGPLVCNGAAYGINSAGLIVGHSSDSNGNIRAVTWQNGVGRALSTPNDNDWGTGHAVNDAGQVAGKWFENGGLGPVHAVIWENGVLRDLGTGTGGAAVGKAINGLGHVAGHYNDESGTLHPAVWRDGTRISLELPDGDSGEALGINDAGQVVGYTLARGAVLWLEGRLIQLESVLPVGSGWVLSNANAINNRGRIVGSGVSVDGGRGFILTPNTPPPATILVEEAVGVGDVPALTPGAAPVQLVVEEMVGATDEPGLMLSVAVLVEETIGATDEPGLMLPIAVVVDEMVGVAEGPNLLPSASILVEEGVGVGDASVPLVAVRLIVDETVHAADTTASVLLDTTPPITTASVTPAPNAAGWHRTDVTVTLAATDNLSGVARTEYNLDGAGWVTYTGPFAITAESVHALQYRSQDRAGNLEAARTLVVRIDKTPPELAASCRPQGAGRGNLIVTGEDAASGVASAVLTATAPETRGEFAERRTYTVTDNAGNTLVAIFRLRQAGSALSASLWSLSYNGGPPTIFESDPNARSNLIRCQWAVGPDGTSLMQLNQEIEIGAGQAVQARFNAQANQTTITVLEPRPRQSIVRTGVVFLRIATEQGRLTVGF